MSLAPAQPSLRSRRRPAPAPMVVPPEHALLLQLGQTGGAALHWLATAGLCELGLDFAALQTAAARRLVEAELRLRGLANRPLLWPEASAVRALQRALSERAIAAVWRGTPGYPTRLLGLPAGDRPAWVLLAGPPRWQRPTCGVIGTRAAAPRWLMLSEKLGRALAEGGLVVTSGQASGCDSAAHAGAAQAGANGAGTLAIPAAGLLRTQPGPPPVLSSGRQLAAGTAGQLAAYSWLGIGRPTESPHAGLAIRRNDVIAACSDALVLVASALHGGSAYAVRWALRHGRPLFCFEDGRRTPAANAQLLRAGQALPLAAGAAPAQWLEQIQAALALPRPKAPASVPTQLRLFNAL